MPKTLFPDAFNAHADALAACASYNSANPKGKRNEVVWPSVPILYFGDLDAYQKSKRRIITLGKNPSNQEFPTANPGQRFPCAATYVPFWPSPGAVPPTYGHDLDCYFKFKLRTYGKWFRALDPVLDGFDASYYSNGSNTHCALHTDFLSPVATDPIWEKLDPGLQHRLQSLGRPLWEKLVLKLKPHIVLVSLKAALKEQIPLVSPRAWSVVGTVSMKWGTKVKQVPVEHQVVRIAPTHDMDVVFVGQRIDTPFSGLANPVKQQIGRNLKGKGQLKNWP